MLDTVASAIPTSASIAATPITPLLARYLHMAIISGTLFWQLHIYVNKYM